MMRIRKLELVRFGMFSDKVFDFGPRPEHRSDFHVIYGPNEAGKTTAAEGFLRLLYGFRSREPFDYIHQRSNLMIRGAVELDGRLKTVVRLPGKTNPLADEHGSALPQSLFQNALSGLEDAEYRKLFCLNDKTIEEGGDEITSGQGDIGHLLFSAAAGISDVPEILDGVRKQAEDLFKRRGSSQRLPRLKRELSDIQHQINEKDTTASQYQTLRKGLAAARAAEGAARERRKDLLDEKSRRQSFVNALPLLEQVKELTGNLSQLEDCPDQIVVSRDVLETLQVDRIELMTKKDSLQREIKEIEGKRLSVTLDPIHLGLIEELERVEELRSRFQTAFLDLPKREQELAEHTGNMRITAEDLGLRGEVDLKAFVLSKPQLAELSRICGRQEELTRQAQRERQEVARLNGLIIEGDAELIKLKTDEPQGGKVLEILNGINVAKSVSDYEAAVEQTRDAAEKAEQARSGLSVRGKDFETVPAAFLTSAEARDLAAQLAQKTNSAEHQRSRLREVEKKRDRSDRQVSQLKNAAGLVTDAEVQQLTARRDKRWDEHRSALTSETADVFEHEMRALDQASDRRLEQASNLGKLRQLESDALDLKSESIALQEDLSRRLSEAKKMRQRLDDVSKTFGIDPPLSPEALADWLQKTEAACAAQYEKSRADQRSAAVFAKAEALRRSLAAAMGFADGSMDFPEIASCAESAAKGCRDHRRKLEAAQDRLDGWRREQQRRAQILKEFESQLSEVSGNLETLITTMFDFDVDHSDLKTFQEALRELRSLERLRSEVAHRIDSMRADMEGFRRAIGDMACRFNVPEGESPTETYAAMKRLADAARQASDSRKALTERQEQASAALSSVQSRLDQLDARVRGIAAGFPPALSIDSFEDLRQAAAKTEETIKSRKELKRLQREMRTMLGVSSVKEAEELLAGLSLTEVCSRLEEAEKDADQADKYLQAAIAKRSSAETVLNGISGDDEIAALVEKRRTLELDMQETALDYLELHFGCRLAEEAIRRYSEKHRSDMLKATEKAFSELTDGAYRKLGTQYDRKKETLVAIDRSGSTKRAETMSKGTRFQLYLALRAAAYEQRASSGVILPFFCDDVFETFDEDRTRAACRLMQRIGRTGQAIYLTHHRHVAEIAKDICSEDARLHEL